MSLSAKKTVEELSRELARVAGIRLRPPQKGKRFHSIAGELRSRIPGEFFHWRKCPRHNVWLQPVLEPFKHWACASYTLRGGEKVPCTFKRPAKLRTQIEHRIFAIMKFLEDNA